MSAPIRAIADPSSFVVEVKGSEIVPAGELIIGLIADDRV